MEAHVHTDGFEQLVPEWRLLLDNDPSATPFVSPEWASAWWPHWAGDARPWIVAVRDGENLVGLAPLALRRRGPFRVLTELGRQPANYWDVLALPERREEVVGAVAMEIARRESEWDAAIFGGLERGSGTSDALASMGLHVRERPPIPYPAVALPTTFEEYLMRLPAKRRKDLRRHLRRLDGGELEQCTVDDPAAVAETVVRWQDLRIRWWAARGRRINPEHASARFGDFMTDVLELLIPRGLARLVEFRMEGRVVAVEISLLDARRLYAWMDGYDPELAKLGLGKVAVAEGIRWSIETGRELFDFMVGDEPYKYWFGAENRYCEWMMLANNRRWSRTTLLADAARQYVLGVGTRGSDRMGTAPTPCS